MRTIVTSAVLALALGLAPASGQSVVGKAQEAERLLAAGKVGEAMDAMDDAAVLLWEKAPLTFRRSVWVTERATGFGLFNARDNAVFSSGQPMLVYAEPIGFGWRKDGDAYRTDMVADIVFRSADGKELFRKDEFLTMQLAGRYRNREFFTNMNYTLTGVPAGEYRVETIFRDRTSGKTGSFTLPLTIR